MQLAPQTLEEHTITLVLPTTEEAAEANYDQLKAELNRLVGGAQRRHPGHQLTYCLDEFVEFNHGDGPDLHIYQLQIMR